MPKRLHLKPVHVLSNLELLHPPEGLHGFDVPRDLGIDSLRHERFRIELPPVVRDKRLASGMTKFD